MVSLYEIGFTSLLQHAQDERNRLLGSLLHLVASILFQPEARGRTGPVNAAQFGHHLQAPGADAPGHQPGRNRGSLRRAPVNRPSGQPLRTGQIGHGRKLALATGAGLHRTTRLSGAQRAQGQCIKVSKKIQITVSAGFNESVGTKPIIR